jgi:hypothetical protein
VKKATKLKTEIRSCVNNVKKDTLNNKWMKNIKDVENSKKSQKNYSFLAKMKDISGTGPGILKELNA